MKSTPRALLICWTLSLPATAAWSADPERIDKPAVQVGTSWRMRVADGYTRVPISETTYRVGAVSDSEIQVLNEADVPILIMDAASYALKRSGDIVFDPQLQRQRYPMAPGDRWEAAYRYESPQCGPTQATLTFKVAAWEDVNPPAGKFRALRVDSEGQLRNGCGTNRHSHKHWYVPDLTVPVRQESTFYGGGRISRIEVHELLSLARP